MGLFEQIAGMLGGPQHVERLASGQATQYPSDVDHQQLSQAMASAPPPMMQQAVTQTTQQMSPQEYAEHITPGVGGTDPLGSLSPAALGTVASSLLGAYMAHGGNQSQLQGIVPGMAAANPAQMGPGQVAQLASYMFQNHPQAFGQAAAQVGQQQPSLLQSMLGNKALMMAAAGVGAKILSDRSQGRAL